MTVALSREKRAETHTRFRMTERFLRSTVLVQFDAHPGTTTSGTGFFIARPIQAGLANVFLVTNAHALPPEGTQKSIRIRVTAGPVDHPTVREIEIPVVGLDGHYLPTVRLHPGGAGVAAVNVTGTILHDKIQAAWIPNGLLVTPEQLKSEGITVGDEIYLLGFPDAIFDQRNPSPILRTGVIATSPLEGYAFNNQLRQKYDLPDRIDGFLIDANVFPGSSGSVVLLKPVPMEVAPGVAAMISNSKKTPYVLGIVFGSIPIDDTAIGTKQRMGLGIVYSATAIRALIETFYP